ncbi:MAG: rhomboid family intramembrane serine protease [Bryobacterales bacterium]|nr:rhomboid family intramembrane serine protease [Bryobacterales bacterium]
MFPIRDTQKSSTAPIVTGFLIAVNVLVFLYESSLDRYSLNHLIGLYGLIPERFPGELSTLFTSMFLHGGWMHLIGNMWFLWIYGDNVEDVMGHAKYLLFYVLCGAAAGLTHVFFNVDSRVPTVGASGAIAGVMGAYMVKFPHSRIITVVFFFFITTVEIPAVIILGYWMLLQTVNGVGSIAYSQVSQGGVAWFAHIGGFVAGIILVFLLGTRQRYSHRRDLYW